MFWRTFTELCAKSGKTSGQAAKEIGISPRTLSKWERGAIPSGRSLIKIAHYFRVPVQSLTTEEDCKDITPDMIKKRGIVVDLSEWRTQNEKTTMDLSSMATVPPWPVTSRTERPTTESVEISNEITSKE